MSLAPGTRLGPYEVTAQIGVGGMGEVYRARDTKLDRDVAIKVLPEALAADPDRIARFQREAKTLAALNHPSIAAIYGLEEAGGVKALVMELVEGPTLADVIERRAGPSGHAGAAGSKGPGLHLDEALAIAKQIAEALEAAHEQGIIHRDLKPANVKVRPDGTVKVLDFGLAKVMEPASAMSASASMSPTITTPAMTQAGMILGTAAYMSPEQAKGRPADKRSDVWAFGAVLYEMLTGRRAFDGEDVSDTLAAVLRGEPDWTALPAATPATIRTLLRRALARDRRARLADMSDARIEIEDAHRDQNEPAAAGVAPHSRRREYAWGGVAAVLALTTVGLAVRAFSTPPAEAVPVVRFDVLTPDGVADIGNVRLSPDGSLLAFVATSDGTRQIWIRPIDASEARPVEGTEGVDPDFFWSPDGRSLGFSAEGQLKTVAATGGSAQVLAALPAGTSYTGTWGANGDILLGGTSQVASGGILRVPSDGGPPLQVSQPDAALKERFHAVPQFLPDGRHYLFLVRGAEADAAYVGLLDSTERVPLPGIGSAVVYSRSGHLVFVRDQALLAQPFDPARLELSGQAMTVVDSFDIPIASAPFSVSSSGTLAFSLARSRRNSRLVWFDRAGRELGIAAVTGPFSNPELSKDDRYVAWDEGPRPDSDTWIRDLTRGLTTRFTSAPGADGIPQWSPDGGTIVYRSDGDGGNLYQRRVGVIDEAAVLLSGDAPKLPTDWSLDGRFVAYIDANDIWMLALPDGKPLRVTRSPSLETNARISPDGEWIAYQSNEGGSARPDEVYLQSLSGSGVKVQVSTTGGNVPRWRRDGKELYYLAPDRTLMAVPMDLDGAMPSVGAPIPLFQTQVARAGGSPSARDYAVSSDGRFLINTLVEEPSVAPISVVINWFEELKRLVPAN